MRRLIHIQVLRGHKQWNISYDCRNWESPRRGWPCLTRPTWKWNFLRFSKQMGSTSRCTENRNETVLWMKHKAAILCWIWTKMFRCGSNESCCPLAKQKPLLQPFLPYLTSSLCSCTSAAGRQKPNMTFLKTSWNCAILQAAPPAQFARIFGHASILRNIAAFAKGQADQAIRASWINFENKYAYQANKVQPIGTLKDRFIRACFLRGVKRRHNWRDCSGCLTGLFAAIPGLERLNSALTVNLISNIILLT